MLRKALFLIIPVMVLIIGCSSDVEDPNPVGVLPEEPPVPSELAASVGDGQVEVTWNVNQTSRVAYFKIYKSDSASASGMQVVDSTAAYEYLLAGLLNGKTYYVRITVVDINGYEGEKSSALQVVPGKFTMMIDQNMKYTKDLDVAITFTSISGTSLVQMAEDSLFTDAVWQTYSSSKSFHITDGDGMKYVYARFELSNGGKSYGHISDSIFLDTKAKIDSVTIAPVDSIFSPGDFIHFALYTAGQEVSGKAYLSISGLGNIDLYDDGFDGDAIADDGIYEVDYRVPADTYLDRVVVTGNFSDEAGNNADDLVAESKLSVFPVVEAVELNGLALTSSEILLEWTESNLSTGFSSYKLFRDESGGVDESSELIRTATSRTSTDFTDSDLDDNTTYYYRIYVYDTHGRSAASEELSLTTKVNEPPDAVNLAARLTTEAREVGLTWVQSDADDFQSYHILRDDVALSGSYDADKVIRYVNSSSTTSTTDQVPDAGVYYYQLFVYDAQGASAGSNVISITVP